MHSPPLLSAFRSTLIVVSLGFLTSTCLAARQNEQAVHHGRVRVHFIAAEEIDWDYAPSGRDEAMGHPFGEFEKNYMESGPHRIGREYKKAVYREYTDARFKQLVAGSADEQD